MRRKESVNWGMFNHILRTNIIRNIWQTVRRITGGERVKGQEGQKHMLLSNFLGSHFSVQLGSVNCKTHNKMLF